MKQRLRFNLLFVIVFVVGMVVSGLVARQTLRHGAQQETVRHASLLLATASAIRAYTIDEVEPALAANNTAPFVPQSVPAFATSQTLKRIQSQFPDYHYREAVIDPTNPADKAVDWELDLIKRFQSDADLDEVVGNRDTDLGPSLYIARPIRLSHPSCLICHSTPDAAPAAMLQRYGRSGGFGWKLGDVVGVQLIRVPLAAPIAQADYMLRIYLSLYVAIFGVLLIALNLPIRRLMQEQDARQRALELAQSQLLDLNQELSKQSTTDALTGLRNRRAFNNMLREQLAAVERFSAPLGLLLFDVDNFKDFNDQFGHVAGDAALAQIGRILLANSRINDVAVRYGGEEFAVLLPGTGLEAALMVAERYRQAVERADWAHRGVTVCIGIAISNNGEQNLDLVVRADKALYEAKRRGRNRVVHQVDGAFVEVPPLTDFKPT